MSFVHGSNTEVWIEGVNASAYFNSADFAVDVDTAETTTFKKSWKTHISGAYQSTIELGGLYDPTYQTIQDALPDSLPIIVTVMPGGGESIGDNARLARVIATSVKESSPVGDVVAFSASLIADTTVGLGKVLHPDSVETSDGSSTSVDNGASTTAGAVAHLHILDISGGDTITVTIEDSANNSAFSTIGTFTLDDAVGAERLVINGTVRRYVRVTWDISDDAGPVQFAVAFARLR